MSWHEGAIPSFQPRLSQFWCSLKPGEIELSQGNPSIIGPSGNRLTIAQIAEGVDPDHQRNSMLAIKGLVKLIEASKNHG